MSSIEMKPLKDIPDQRDAKIETLSVEVTQLRSELQACRASNAALARQASVSADRVVEELEVSDELRIKLNAAVMREKMLASEIADLRMERQAHVMDRALVAVEQTAAAQ